MNGDPGLVACLVDRLTTRLPYRTGNQDHDLNQDDIATVTRTTLLKISANSIDIVLDTLWALLEDLARPYKVILTHPAHIVASEIYILALAADCCGAHWKALQEQDTNGDAPARENGHASGPRLPAPLDDGLITRMFDLLKSLLLPILEGFQIGAGALLDEMTDTGTDHLNEELLRSLPRVANEELLRSEFLTFECQKRIDLYVRDIISFVSAANWATAFEIVKSNIYSIRVAPPPQAPPVPNQTISEEESSQLVTLRLIAYLWLDSRKLALLIQELCSSFLHFRRLYQHTIVNIGPLMITRWIDRYPSEFSSLHNQRRRLDGSVDTLFDMIQSLDTSRKRHLLFPLQTALLLLLPDVFEVASNMRDVKGGSMSKKISYLDSLRKALRNRNEVAGYCLVCLLRAARHFRGETEAALVSYAMDVQDEVRDAVFRRPYPGSENAIFEQELITAAFISLTHLNADPSIESLGPTCLSPGGPQAFKSAVIQGCAYFARQPDADRFRPLCAMAAGFVQSQLKIISTASADLYIGDPSSQRRASENSVETTAMACNILEFLDASPMTLFDGAPTADSAQAEQFYEENFESFASCLVTANDSVRGIATSVAKKLLAEDGVLASFRKSKKLFPQGLKSKFWKLASLVLMKMCDNHVQQGDRASLKSVYEYLDSRLLLLNSVEELVQVSSGVVERAAASTKLETLFLVALCSADLETCQLVTSCVGLFTEECRIVDSASDAAKTGASSLRNAEVFIEIASRDFRFTGIVAFQKRIRGLLRRMTYPSAGILDAWEFAFDKWLHLSKDVSTTPVEAVDERHVSEWRNYSGFLASLGGICTAEQALVMDEPAVSGLRWIDRVSSERHEEPLLSRYLRLSVQLLACSNVIVRETIREVLSTDISPSLHQPLFKALESELEVLFTGALEAAGKGQDSEVIFAEQSASLLKALIEKLENPLELGSASSVHFGSLTLSFAKFLDGSTDNMNSLRVKIKISQLCETVIRKREHLNLRDDVRIRNQLLEYIFSWIARPRSPRPAELSYPGIGARPDEVARVQKDLDKACLRSLAELTYRLPLQPGDGQNDAGTSELKSQMFQTYFNRFLSLLNHEPAEYHRTDIFINPSGRDDSASTSELCISILSNLLSANIDVGLKHSLSLGYHENVEIRTAFVKVLYNILVQGTEFSNLSDAAMTEKYGELIGLLTQDMTLAVAVSNVCPSNEVDELTISLLNIFETRGLTYKLMEALIKQEIEETENEAELLRRNCVATKMLSIYAKWKGNAYLKATLQKVLERLMLTSNELDLELDPARISSQEELTKNAAQLRIVATVFIVDICSSATSMPASFRKICSIISATVMSRFPEAKYTAVGAFIFLRFFCPAIVAPDVEGLVASPPSKEMRRGLLLIAKVIQNLANNVLFGAKEPYMYQLNDFLTQNIYRVTTFLREIAVPPEADPISTEAEAYDFGSSVALHRFMYDHWDQVRQRLISQERRDQIRSPTGDSFHSKTGVLEPLRALITNLGPPPLAVTWNRPQISANTPPAYSRFQHFMLRNAFRSAESFMTSRAVYDGGESKDGLSIICIILRHIDTDAIDFDTLLYCYLRIASRLWHRPFGLLIDATCYNGQNEPPDDLFKKLDLLSPVELSRQLSRVYVYNMNSTFRKCFRRVLKVATKTETGIFNPNNVEYHLIGSLQDLQSHFHLSQLHLPKETISVVTDTRYVFQPITRLSKTKGKIEVTIKVGSQFVQITTTRKQEVHPGFRLNATVNDIFRLGEVEEATTSIPTEDDSAFGLRADNGKIVMYFQSPKKLDVLQAIRGAKAKYAKDTRAMKSFERLIRPQDVPGTLLNLALTNLASPDSVLRVASYNLLGSLCRAFKFKAAAKFMCHKDLSVPLEPTKFIVNISKMIAQDEPQLTSDFLNEFFVGWESFHDEQKPLSLAYMAPWLPSLRTTLLAEDTDGDKSRDKIATIFRKLIDLAISDPSLALPLEQIVWPAIYNDETLLEIFLEEIIKLALSLGLYDEQTQALASIVTSIGTITLRGRIISRLRKALNRSSLRPTKHLPENAVWAEICMLLQFCLSLSFDCGVQSQLYLPEIFHIVTMLANIGTTDIRSIVHKLLINSIHAACTSFKLDDTKHSKLRAIVDMLSEPKNDIFTPVPAPLRDAGSISTSQDSGAPLGATETLAGLLFEVCNIAAPSVDMSNAWRSRWMSLVASTAFQNNPAIQPRAFAVMGCLAREEVDDDLLYQVLVALRNSIGRFGEDNNADMLVAIITSLSKMMSKLPSASRYGVQLFWLAMSLLRLVPANLFNCVALFLEAVLTNISIAPEMRSDKTTVAQYLLQGRVQLEDAALPLDDAYGVHFTLENFHFATCACLVRGLTDNTTKPTAMRVTASLMESTISTALANAKAIPALYGAIHQTPYFALIQSRARNVHELKDNLWITGLPVGISFMSPDQADLTHVKDKDLLLETAIGLVDLRYLEDSVQTRNLMFLATLAKQRPSIILRLSSALVAVLDDILLHSQNSATLEWAHLLLQTMSSNSKFMTAPDSSDQLNETLDDMGFGGLWRSCSFSQPQEPDKICYSLTEKLIELIII